MSAISSVGSAPISYQPVSKVSTQPKAAFQKAQQTATKPANDPDHDGDTDGPGVDLKG